MNVLMKSLESATREYARKCRPDLSDNRRGRRLFADQGAQALRTGGRGGHSVHEGERQMALPPPRA